MSSKMRLVSIPLGLVVAVVLTLPAGASKRSDLVTIEPGQTKVFACGWGYGPIAREHALRVGGHSLEIRAITRTSPSGHRVVFAHEVTVREDLGRYRTIFNRGRRTVRYRDDCPGAGTGSE